VVLPFMVLVCLIKATERRLSHSRDPEYNRLTGRPNIPGFFPTVNMFEFWNSCRVLIQSRQKLADIVQEPLLVSFDRKHVVSFVSTIF